MSRYLLGINGFFSFQDDSQFNWGINTEGEPLQGRLVFDHALCSSYDLLLLCSGLRSVERSQQLCCH